MDKITLIMQTMPTRAVLSRILSALCLVLIVLSIAGHAQSPNTGPKVVVREVSGLPVTYQSGDETVSGMLYTPSGSGPHPALVVIQEYWGLNDWVKSQAADFAAHGYVALAVDLYRGKVADTPEVAHELMRGMPQDRAMRDLTAAVNYLSSRKDVRADRIGTVGWCMGGGYALQLALADPKSIHAVAMNYGALATDRQQLAQLTPNVLGNFGGLDRGIPPADVNAFAATLKELGKDPDIKIYPEAGHAFENSTNHAAFRADDAADARARMLAFFKKTLQP